MDLVISISSLAGLLLLGLVLKPLFSHLRFPFEALLLLLGFAFSSLIVDADELGLHSGIFRDLVFYVFLPVLIFSAAYSMDVPRFGRNLFGIILLALPLALISLAFSTVLIYYGMGHPAGFPWNRGSPDRHHADRHPQPGTPAGIHAPEPSSGPAYADPGRRTAEQCIRHRAVHPPAGFRAGTRPDSWTRRDCAVYRLGSGSAAPSSG